jgi:hypothetical protein
MRQEKTLGKKQWKYAEARTRRPTLPLLLFCLFLLHNGVKIVLKQYRSLITFQDLKKLMFYPRGSKIQAFLLNATSKCF